jgi:hypothetical protein
MVCFLFGTGANHSTVKSVIINTCSILYMKKVSLLLLTGLLLSTVVSAQDPVIKRASCHNEMIKMQADSVKQTMARDGYVVVREASMAMESEYEMAVLVPLTEGSNYQFIFIGDVTSKLYEVRMYDSEEKQVVYQKKMWGDVDGNVISFSYIPRFSEFFAIRPVQVNKKKKELCGYVMLMKKMK